MSASITVILLIKCLTEPLSIIWTMTNAAESRPQFGSRYLTNTDDVFEHNAWDDVNWDEAQEIEAEEKVSKNSAVLMCCETAANYKDQADHYWDSFYAQHNTGFFKDRNWLFTEFPDLMQWNKNNGQCRVNLLEVGCGVGNTVFPLLEANQESTLFVYCCDFSSVAVDLLQKNESFNPNRCKPFVWDITKPDDTAIPVEQNSLDVILMIFVLSAITPAKMQDAVNNVIKFLKPGGLLLFRDYGRYDLAQLRFKPGRCVSKNFYVRGDGTQVYFFTQEELDSLFTEAGLVKEINRIDRRLQVNRLKLLKMYRIWIQCNYRKPLIDTV